MALIEGVGDEVTLLFGSLLLLTVLLLAWVSTRTAEPPEQLFPGHAPSPQDTPISSTASVGDGSLSEAPPTGPSPREEEEAEPEAGDGARRRGVERSMVVRLKFLNDTERTAQVQPHDTIGYIKRAATGAAGGPRPADQVQVALNVGSLMVPLLVLMLSVLWYCQIQYRQFFTAPATASLVGITIFLSLVAFGVLLVPSTTSILLLQPSPVCRVSLSPPGGSWRNFRHCRASLTGRQEEEVRQKAADGDQAAGAPGSTGPSRLGGQVFWQLHAGGLQQQDGVRQVEGGGASVFGLGRLLEAGHRERGRGQLPPEPTRTDPASEELTCWWPTQAEIQDDGQQAGDEGTHVHLQPALQDHALVQVCHLSLEVLQAGRVLFSLDLSDCQRLAVGQELLEHGLLVTEPQQPRHHFLFQSAQLRVLPQALL
ncbi:hypothetical protein CCH79_00020372 [Gambusia affinis]|uniref:Ubiquitin-like domain-containing protein n=1 Tax=Gambusia affinis TaxID=33528 RepID=A0A315WV68_GAMAF|nr:hypothetical protein CCH79_00020372 [Gambusia affinis]